MNRLARNLSPALFAALVALSAVRAYAASPTDDWTRAYDLTLEDTQGIYSQSTKFAPAPSFLPSRVYDKATLVKALTATFARAHDRPSVLDDQQAQRWTERVQVGFPGIGVELKTIALTGDSGVVITNVTAGSPAEDALLKVGDRILRINGKNISGLSVKQVRDLLEANKKERATNLAIIRAVPNSADEKREFKTVEVQPDMIDGLTGIDFDIAPAHFYPSVTHLRRAPTPAGQAGMQEGDIVLAINGRSMDGVDLPGVVDVIRHDHSPLSFAVLRGGIQVTMAVSRSLIPDFWTAFDYRGEANSSDHSDPHNSWSKVTLKHMDWDVDWMYESVLGEIESGNDFTALILDLSGAGGNNTDAAARVAARFVDKGVLFQVQRGYGEHGVTVTYDMVDGVLWKVESGARVSSVILDTPKAHFHKKLVVLVDSGTTGAAAAIAYAVQSHHAGSIAGTLPFFLSPNSRQSITDVLKEQTPNGDLLISVPGAKLLGADGKWSMPVSLDNWLVEGSQEGAMRVAGGKWIWQNGDSMLTIGMAILFLLCGVACLDQIRIKRALRSKQAAGSVTAAKTKAPMAATTGATTIASALAPQSGPKKARHPLERFAPILAIGLLMTALFGLPWLFLAPPLGTKAVMSVQLYTDDTNDSWREKAIFNQLQTELHGDIRFENFDLNEHPEMLDKSGNWSQTAVPSAPTIRIRIDWFDRNGHKLNDDWRGTGFSNLISKRLLLDMIMSSSTMSYKEYWPNPHVTRTFPASH